MLLLPTELQYQICFQLSLKDIKGFLLSYNTNININWRDYFFYHTGIDVKLLDNFMIVDKEFMIEHGRYLLDKPVEIIKQYLKIYPKLLLRNLTDENIVWNEIRFVYFSRKAKPCIRLAFVKYKRASDGQKYMKYQKEIQEHGEVDYCVDKMDLLSSIYDEIKSILLNDELKFVVMVGTDHLNTYIKIDI